MKLIVFAFAAFCAVARSQNWHGIEHPFPTDEYQTTYRFRREADPQGSLILHGSQHTSGPDRRPSINLDYNHRIHDNGRSTVDVFGGANKVPGQPIRPEIGVRGEHKIGEHGFINGQVRGSHGPNGRFGPSFGINTGVRFRREANPQGSIILHGSQHTSGPDRRPSINLDYNHRIHDNGRSTVDVFGGANKVPGQPIRPEIGVRGEHKIGEHGFINGQVRGSHGPNGRFGPSFGVNTGVRFRREADPQGSLILHGSQHTSGPDRRPSINLDYNHRIHDNGRSTVDVFGGANKVPGQPIRPEIGVRGEHKIGEHGFINGQVRGSHGPNGRFGPSFGINTGVRFRREADPQGSVVLQGTKPLSGPDRRPSINLDYNHRIHDNGRSTVDVFGGANKVPGQPIRPEFGVRGERKFGQNGFINGQVGGIQGPRGRVSPTFGVSTGFRFRREADPQGSIVLQGTKPLSGPDRRPSINLDYNHRIHDNGRSTVDVFGGANKVPGQPIRPEFGVRGERKFGQNGFINGQVGGTQGPRGRISPTFGVNSGFRFRREAEDEREFEQQADEEIEFKQQADEEIEFEQQADQEIEIKQQTDEEIEFEQ